MSAEWDPEKAEANFKKLRIRFADAVSALEDDGAITIRDVRPDEERWVTIGMDATAQVLVVVYTWRGQDVRVISARPATTRERRQYEEDR